MADCCHFCLKFSTILPIAQKTIEIETSLLIQRRDLGVRESSGDIDDNVRLKMANWQSFWNDIFNVFTHKSEINRDRDFVVVSRRGLRVCVF